MQVERQLSGRQAVLLGLLGVCCGIVILSIGVGLFMNSTRTHDQGNGGPSEWIGSFWAGPEQDADRIVYVVVVTEESANEIVWMPLLFIYVPRAQCVSVGIGAESGTPGEITAHEGLRGDVFVIYCDGREVVFRCNEKDALVDFREDIYNLKEGNFFVLAEVNDDGPRLVQCGRVLSCEYAFADANHMFGSDARVHGGIPDEACEAAVRTAFEELLREEETLRALGRGG